MQEDPFDVAQARFSAVRAMIEMMQYGDGGRFPDLSPTLRGAYIETMGRLAEEAQQALDRLPEFDQQKAKR